jgi:superfamily II DNA or RNA helicase
VTLRPYQVAALEAVKHRLVERGIVAHATGTGKGHIMPYVPEVMNLDRGVLYLAHRKELIGQLADHIRRVHGASSVSIEQAERRASLDTPFIVASTETLRPNGKRLDRLLGWTKAIMLDEAHHACAPMALKRWSAFGILDSAGVKSDPCRIPLIGWTATPSRGDKVGLHNVFDGILHSYHISQAIKDGWLVPVVAWTVETGVDLSEVHTSHGDFKDGELSRAVNTERRTARIFEAWDRHARGTKTLVFCVDVQHAKDVAAFFESRGVSAAHVSGDMDSGVRSATFAWFASTPGAVLTNCQLVEEGINVPSIESIIMGAPTLSAVRYSQRLGRGTRLADGAHDIEESIRLGKAHVRLVDVVDTIKTAKRAVGAMTIFGAPIPEAKLDGDDVMEAVAQQRKRIEEDEARARSARSKAIDLFYAPSEAPSGTDLMWLPYGTDAHVLLLPDRSMVRVQSDELDRWYPERLLPHSSIWMRSETIPASGSEEEALKAVEAWASTNYADSLQLIRRSASWRTRPLKPKPKQILFAAKLGIPVLEDTTRGQLSEAIDRALARRRRA